METPDTNLTGHPCKSFGKIEKIQKYYPAEEDCIYSLRFKISNNNKYYLFDANKRDDKIPESKCHGFLYAFSGGQNPKVGDTIYFTSTYGENIIISYGKDIYNSNQNLPDCGQYFINPFDGTYNYTENYEIMDMCKVSGKIENIIRTPDDKGFSNGLNIKILSNNNEIFNLGATELVFDKYGQSKVLGLSTTYPTVADDRTRYFPKNGDNFYALLDKSTNQILQVGKYNYDSNLTRPDCIGEKNMEKTYDPTTTCKASGVITKIIGGDKTIHDCGYYYRFKLNDGTRDYIIRGLEKNNNGTGSFCENGFYAFSGGQLPKVGNEMYVIGKYSDSSIIEQGKDIYNKNLNLPNCEIYSDLIGGDAFLWADKCRVSGKVEKIKKTFTDICGFNLKIEVKNNNDTYFVGGREYFTGDGISVCLGVGDGWFPIDITGGKITTKINSGDNFYAVLDQKDNNILKYGLDGYNLDSSIPTCTSNQNIENQSMTGGITQDNIKLVMNAVQKEVFRLDPFHNNLIKIKISTGTTTKTGVLVSTGSKVPDKKIEQNNVKTQKINKKTLNSPIKNKEIVKKDNTGAVLLGTGSNENNSISNTENILNKDNTNTGNEVINKQEEVISNTQTTTQTTKNNEILNQNSVNNSKSYVNYLIIFLFILTIIFILIKSFGLKKKR